MRSLLLLSLLFLLLACDSATDSVQTDTPAAEESAMPVLTPPDIYCYKNIFPYTDGSGKKDVEEMTLIIMGDIVTGVLATVPAEKDSRKGKLTGTRKDDVLALSYVYVQEGKLDTNYIRVTLADDAARISSQDPSFRVPKQINKIPCEQ